MKYILFLYFLFYCHETSAQNYIPTKVIKTKIIFDSKNKEKGTLYMITDSALIISIIMDKGRYQKLDTIPYNSITKISVANPKYKIAGLLIPIGIGAIWGANMGIEDADPGTRFIYGTLGAFAGSIVFYPIGFIGSMIGSLIRNSYKIEKNYESFKVMVAKMVKSKRIQSVGK